METDKEIWSVFFLSFLLSPPSSSFFPSSSSTSSARKTPGFLICACESWQQEDTCDLNSGWGLVLILPLPGRATLGWSLVLLSLGFITCKMGKIMPVMLGGWQEQGSKWLQTLINCQRTLTPLMQNCRRWGEGSTEQTVRSGGPGLQYLTYCVASGVGVNVYAPWWVCF